MVSCKRNAAEEWIALPLDMGQPPCERTLTPVQRLEPGSGIPRGARVREDGAEWLEDAASP